jgi:hypothetical protein
MSTYIDPITGFTVTDVGITKPGPVKDPNKDASIKLLLLPEISVLVDTDNEATFNESSIVTDPENVTGFVIVIGVDPVDINPPSNCTCPLDIIPFFMFNSFGISYKYIKDQNVI